MQPANHAAQKKRWRPAYRVILAALLVGVVMSMAGNVWIESVPYRADHPAFFLQHVGMFLMGTTLVFFLVMKMAERGALEGTLGETTRPLLLLGPDVTDTRAREAIRKNPRARVLSLADASITDDVLPALSRMKKLEFLNLAGTPITDRGAVQLESLTWLQRLDLSRTQVTRRAISELQTMLPNCEIVYPDRSELPPDDAD